MIQKVQKKEDKITNDHIQKDSDWSPFMMSSGACGNRNTDYMMFCMRQIASKTNFP